MLYWSVKSHYRPFLGYMLLAFGLMVVFATMAEARRARNAVRGAAIGAGVGALIDGGQGARTGAAAGAVAGAIVRR